MNQTACRSCGANTPADARFCRACGEFLAPAKNPTVAADATAPAPRIAVAPPPVAPPRPAPLGPPPGSDRALRVVAIGAVMIVAILGVVLTVVLIGSNGSSKATPTTTLGVPPTTAHPTTTPRAVPTESDLERTARRMDALLARSAGTRPRLQDLVITPFVNCDISAEQAYRDIDSVIENRQMMVDTLGRMSSNDPQGRELIRLLAVAMRHSLDSDFDYKSWIGSNLGGGCPPDAGRQFRVDGDNVSQNATAAKQNFLGQYLPIARTFGLKSDWQFGDI